MSLWLLFPLIGALIGWLIAAAGVWLLFNPAKPTTIAGIQIQGLVHKRKAALLKRISNIVATEFFSMQEIEEKLVSSDNFQKLMPSIEGHIDEFLQHKLPKAMPVLSMFVGEKIIKQLKDLFMEELAIIFPAVMKKYVAQLQQEINLEDVLQAKLAAIPSERIEVAIKELFAKELRLMKVMGALAGLLIGLIQLIIAWSAGLIG
jgi:uncharacterized membrane protein YheB (UPF0754 family)